MKQILQDLKNGDTSLVDVPCPQVKKGHLLIRTRASLISLGTERMLVNFGRSGYLDKARQQPEKVKQVIAKIKTDGLMPTIDAVKAKLDAPLAMGYCNAGVVIEVGDGVEGFEVGDRVASNGGHAEIVRVPANLCSKIPDSVTDDQACFTVAGSISLQGIRLLQPTLGERIVVMGLGLMGLLAVQILKANGCEVLGVDLDPRKCELARRFGAEVVDISRGDSLEGTASGFSSGRGVDGVLITASTPSSDPVNNAALVCRKRGRIVQVGATGLNLDRDALYKKEISLQISCSYGPGRYDPFYEDRGNDYPIAYVRWTEQRNFEAVLGLMASGAIGLDELTTHRFSIDEATKAYDLVMESRDAMGIVLSYDSAEASSPEQLRSTQVQLSDKGPQGNRGGAVFGVLGAGSFASRFIIPNLVKAGATMHTIVSSTGVSSTHEGKKHGFLTTSTDTRAVFDNTEINSVIVATQHNTHARFVRDALKAGKAVFVEKPVCITPQEMDAIREAYQQAENPYLMVGYNRRFSSLVQKMRDLAQTTGEPKTIVITVNAGILPDDHWHHDRNVGGGRVLGEACHFLDLIRYITDSPVERVEAVEVGKNDFLQHVDDKVSITLRMKDGSIGTVHYFGNGPKDFPKERIELFVAGRALQLDNFKVLKGYSWPGFKKLKNARQDKGHADEFKAVVETIGSGKPAPIPFEEIDEIMSVCFEVMLKAK